MFETSKLPTEQRTVTGNPVSFNTHYALPLDACKISFEATQAGSGDPSPSNPRAISGVSAIGLTANSTPVSVSLGDTRYGGYVDLVSGVMSVEWVKKVIDETSGVSRASNGILYLDDFFDIPEDTMSVMCNCYTRGDNRGTVADVNANNANYSFCCKTGGTKQVRILIKDKRFDTIEEFNEWVALNPISVLVKLATPQIIQLSANELSSILGNNSFSTDTGTLEITFADLQEKSASGSVATFNTALAMPLSSCNIAVNAWQEGSGDPSPSNVRPIHGFSEVNATRAGKNWCPYANLAGKRRVERSISLPVGSYVFSALCTSTDTDSTVCAFMFQYTDGTYSSLRQLQRNVRSSNTINIAKLTRYLYVYASNNDATGVNDDFTFSDIQIEAGSTVTAYEPYVTPTIYTIQLGQEVYGAEVDVVNGVTHCTWNEKTVSELSFTAQSGNRFTATISDCVNTPNFTGFLCSTYKPILVNANNNTWLSNRVITIVDNRYTTATEFKEAMGDTQIVYPLANPFDIQLTPTQIETLIGNNTIFADTGDIDLTYKDLDIAKRGNFREVFKLPS